MVGARLCHRLSVGGWHVTAGLRREKQHYMGDESLVLGDLRDYGSVPLTGFDAIVHLAARVHDPGASASDYRTDNAQATEALAIRAAADGVRHLVFSSTVKVFGEGRERPYRVGDPALPEDHYAASKWQAEQLLQNVAGLDVSIVRSPMVYGHGSRANFAALQAMSARRTPLPLGMVENRRSFVALDNLCSLIESLLTTRLPGVFVVRDGRDLSTRELVGALRRVQGTPDLELPVPLSLLRSVLGRERAAKLLGSLTVDDGPTRRALGWKPEVSVDQGLYTAVTGMRRPRRLLILDTEDWLFWSHRRDLARAVLAAGWEVHLACRVSEHGTRIRADGVHLHPVPWSRSEPVTRTLRDLPMLTTLYRRITPDVAHHVAVEPSVVGDVVARRTGVPVVVNALAGLGSVLNGRSPAAVLLRAGVRRALRNPNQWLVVQNADDRTALRPWTNPDRCMLIPGSGVDTSVFGLTPQPRGEIRIALVSRMLASEGTADAVAAVGALVRDGLPVKLLLVGDTDVDSVESVPTSQHREWADLPFVEWTAHIEDASSIWATSHIAVLPSTHTQGLPKALLEAAASGRPLVAYDNAWVRDIVMPGRTGLLVPPSDVTALTEALRELVVDADLRRNLGIQARSLIEASYDNASIWGRFLRLYDHALGMGIPDH